jgi:hypothetical protein
MNAELSSTMKAARDYAQQHGALCRYPGGFWSKPGGRDEGGMWFSTPTVQALVKRGVAAYTEWVDGRSGRFPVRAELMSNAPATKKPGGNDEHVSASKSFGWSQ